MSGDADKDEDGFTTFRPRDNVSRYQFVTTLYRLAGEPDTTGLSNPFTDVNLKKDGTKPYYYDPVIWAYDAGVTTGKTATTFAGSQNISRQQMATMLYRYAEVKGFDISGEADITGYPDYSKVAGYAKAALAWANEESIITGKEIGGQKFLDPGANATRQECATILQRFMERYMSDR